MTTNFHTKRSALSLLEVVLAMAILAGSFATLAQLVSLGIRAAGHGRDLTQGQIIAETALSEIAAGIVQPTGLSGVPSEMNPDWLISVVSQATQVQGIIQVTVVAERDATLGRPARYDLTRWMRDPSLAIPTEEEDTGSTAAGSSSGSSSATGGATGNNSGGATGGATGGNTGGANGGGNSTGGANGGGNAGANGGAAPNGNAQPDPRAGGGGR